jgi:hypothetical protein
MDFLAQLGQFTMDFTVGCIIGGAQMLLIYWPAIRPEQEIERRRGHGGRQRVVPRSKAAGVPQQAGAPIRARP